HAAFNAIIPPGLAGSNSRAAWAGLPKGQVGFFDLLVEPDVEQLVLLLVAQLRGELRQFLAQFGFIEGNLGPHMEQVAAIGWIHDVVTDLAGIEGESNTLEPANIETFVE